MTHVIYNISIILILISIILLTHSLTKIYNKCPITVQQKQEINQNIINQDRPSKIFNKMFNSPDIWMGYADFDTKDFNQKII
jgi:NhaP-type Na+/H+ and K+/H+ antiporter